MACIINPNHPTSKGEGHIWGAFCGKTLCCTNSPFKTPEEALKSGEPICKTCRKICDLPPAKKRTPIKASVEPFVIYTVSMGNVKEMTATKETPTAYRLTSGELYPKTPIELSGVWRHVNGRVASRSSIVTDKNAAIELALKQNEAFREFLYQQLDSANEQHSLLKEQQQEVNNEHK